MNRMLKNQKKEERSGMKRKKLRKVCQIDGLVVLAVLLIIILNSPFAHSWNKRLCPPEEEWNTYCPPSRSCQLGDPCTGNPSYYNQRFTVAIDPYPVCVGSEHEEDYCVNDEPYYCGEFLIYEDPQCSNRVTSCSFYGLGCLPYSSAAGVPW